MYLPLCLCSLLTAASCLADGNYCNTYPSPACHFDPTAAPGDPGACDFGACLTGINGNADANLTGNNASAKGGSPGGCVF